MREYRIRFFHSFFLICIYMYIKGSTLSNQMFFVEEHELDGFSSSHSDIHGQQRAREEVFEASFSSSTATTVVFDRTSFDGR